MSAPGKTSREVRLGLGLLALACLFLAVRTQRTVSTVLHARGESPAAATAAPGEAALPLAQAASRDSLIRNAFPGERDPFLGSLVSGWDPASPGKKGGRVRETPVLRALLYDGVHPTVQLSISKETSPWLQPGDAFQGWTVVTIESTSVTLSRNGKSVILPSS